MHGERLEKLQSAQPKDRPTIACHGYESKQAINQTTLEKLKARQSFVSILEETCDRSQCFAVLSFIRVLVDQRSDELLETLHGHGSLTVSIFRLECALSTKHPSAMNVGVVKIRRSRRNFESGRLRGDDGFCVLFRSRRRLNWLCFDDWRLWLRLLRSELLDFVNDTFSLKRSMVDLRKFVDKTLYQLKSAENEGWVVL